MEMNRSETARTEPSYCLNGEVEGASRLYRIQAGVNPVGSHLRNNIILPTFGVSREHAVIRLEEGRLSIRDRGSTNGTFVNGRRIAEAALATGDRVGLGPVELEIVRRGGEDLTLAFTIEAGAAEAAPEPGAPEPGEQTTEHLPADSEIHARRRAILTSSLVFPDDYVVGHSAAMTSLYRQMRCLLRGPVPVILLGETGVGKEHFAQILHRSSDRSSGTFIALNCAAIPAELLEAEMFGIAAGVATGVQQRPGSFRQAHGGTLFLDEVDSMPAALQAKLLRAIEQDEIRPVGGQPQSLDVRIVAATNGDLPAFIDEGSFRRDLYYRLAGYELRVPLLRERRDDIPALVEHFVRRFSAESGKSVQGMSLAAMKDLARRDWPGNVRELRHEVRRLVYFCPEGEAIRTPHLRPPAREGCTGWVERLVEDNGHLDLQATLSAIEAQMIRMALQRTAGNKTAAAQLLGVTRNGLRIKLKRLSIGSPLQP